jgi:hypothetical protein
MSIILNKSPTTSGSNCPCPDYQNLSDSKMPYLHVQEFLQLALCYYTIFVQIKQLELFLESLLLGIILPLLFYLSLCCVYVRESIFQHLVLVAISGIGRLTTAVGTRLATGLWPRRGIRGNE